MTVDELIEHLTMMKKTGVKGSAQIRAWDGDSERMEPITGFLYDKDNVDICTDDMGG